MNLTGHVLKQKNTSRKKEKQKAERRKRSEKVLRWSRSWGLVMVSRWNVIGRGVLLGGVGRAGDRNKGVFTSSFVAVPMATAPRRRPHGCKHVMDVSLSSGRDMNAGFNWVLF